MDGAFGLTHESGELNPSDTLDLFARLIKTGPAWTLQDRIGRTASDLIQFGWITPAGLITTEVAVNAAGPPDWSS